MDIATANGTLNDTRKPHRKVPRAAVLRIIEWMKSAASAEQPKFDDSRKAVQAIFAELGHEISPGTFRSIAKDAGIDLSRLIRHHGVGEGNSRSPGRAAKMPAADVAARLAAIEAMLREVCKQLGVTV